MIIALDAMGGDKAPDINIEGAVLATKYTEHEVLLVGKQEVLYPLLDKYAKIHNVLSSKIKIINATEVIEMHESPASAVRQKKDSSMAVCAKLVVDKQADAFVSMGNSGAAMATAIMYFKRIPGVLRPAISTPFPTISGMCTILDVGANVDCKPEHLVQFAIMGSIYAEKVLGHPKPKIGIISIGEEDTKGNELTFAVSDMLKKTSLNFIGNIEGGDIVKGKAHVVICDGFIGNVILKFGEGVADMVIKLVKDSVKSNPLFWGMIPFLKLAMYSMKKRVDYTEQGGAPLLGVNEVCLIGHGKSNAKAVKNAIIVSAKYASKHVNDEIAQELAKYEGLIKS
ncbi:MAG: phosphate acyltransferase PlsX [Endomicrobiaceae bacterium]|nr:phosphate acyltransferase PlsX [Endomicrobiaceae bacterium]